MKSRSSLYSRYFTYIKPLGKLPIVKNYGPTVFTLLTISTLIFFAIKPTVETILILQKKLAQQEEVLQKVTQKANNLALGKKNFDNLDPEIKNKITAAIPDNVSLKSLIQSLEQAARNHEASVSALQIQPLVIDSKTGNQMRSLSEVSFTFNVEGKYANLVALLKDLKNSARLLSIENLSLSKASETENLIMSLSGKTFYLK
jgi:Tfp pilus assembly protein PilO